MIVASRKKNIGDIVDCILLVFLMMSFYVFYMMSWGRYVFFGVTLMIFGKLILSKKLVIKYSRGILIYLGMQLAFCAYCFFSALWAWDAGLSISKGITIFETVCCFFLLYLNFYQKGRIEPLLWSILLSGVVVSIYTIFYYGASTVIDMIINGIRTQNDFANANSIGLLMAMAMVILYFFLLQKKSKLLVLLFLPLFIVLLITQSRKAFILVIFGLFLITATSGIEKRLIKRMVYILGAVVLLIVMLYAVSRISLFSAVFKRFTRLFESYSGIGKLDVRTIYRRIGMKQFFQTPIFGIGIGNSSLLLAGSGEEQTYLHCNYVELLACGGVVGFIIYYAMYAYLLINLWKYRHFRSKTTWLCLVLLFLLIVMDYGMVSYYSKKQYLYLMCFYLQVNFIKKDAKRQTEKNPRLLSRGRSVHRFPQGG